MMKDMDKARGKYFVLIIFFRGFGGGLDSGLFSSLFGRKFILELALEHAAAGLVENQSVDLLDDFEILSREALSEVFWEHIG